METAHVGTQSARKRRPWERKEHEINHHQGDVPSSFPPSPPFPLF